MKSTRATLGRLEQVSFLGIASSDDTAFFYYRVEPDKLDVDLLGILDDVLQGSELSGPEHYDHIYELLKDPSEWEGKGVISIEVVAFNITTAHHPNLFLSDAKAVGVHIRQYSRLDIYGFKFDEDLFVAEGRIFGLVISIGLFLLIVAWRTLLQRFESQAQLSQLSLHSYVMHLGFDFSYAVFVFNLGELSDRFRRLYVLLFLLMLACYFMIEMRMVSEVWKASIGDMNDLAMNQARRLFMDFFLEVTFVLFAMSGIMTYVFDYPWVVLTLVYSFFIPQIIHSIRSPVRKTKDAPFLIATAIARMLPVWYFSAYRMNVMSTWDPALAAYMTCYMGVQLAIVLLQNRFGGAFFLIKSMRPVPFDYHAERPPDGHQCAVCLTEIEGEDMAMMTPCNHGFHEECLRRWMQEQMVCPVCRRPLPGVDNI